MPSTFTRDPRPRIQYTADGSRTEFAFPFEVLNADDLLVYLGQEHAQGYAVNGLGAPRGGMVVFAEPPRSGTAVTLLRRTEGIRETAFADGSPFRAAAVNAEFDRIMMLIQEDREEHGRALSAHPTEGQTDFSLPPVAERANAILGFDSAGKPTALRPGNLPVGGDGGGLLVTPTGGNTARALGEHLSARVNVRDFGARGDGVSNDAAAFAAAVSAAQARKAAVYVPASPNAYVLGSGITLNGAALIGDGPGSLLKLALSTGFGLQLTGAGAQLANLRLLGPGAASWPAGASQVGLAGVSLDGVRIAAGASDALLDAVEIAGCHTALAIQGGVRTLIGCAFLFSRNGIEVRSGAKAPIFAAGCFFQGCSKGVRIDGAADLPQLALRGGALKACGLGVELLAPASGWRSIEISDAHLEANLEADLKAGARHALAVRSCALDAAGRRLGARVRLVNDGQTLEAPAVAAENNGVADLSIATVQLSGGSNLHLLSAGDLLVLASNADDIDDHWTALKATRCGVVHRVTAQTSATATIRLAPAAGRPFLAAGNQVRVVGRAGTAQVDSVSSLAAAGAFTWLKADDHCRVFAAHNPTAEGEVELGGPNAELTRLPGRGGKPSIFGGVELAGGKINGGFARLVTLEIAQNAAVSFTPDSTIGMVHAFGHSALGDPIAAVFTYRADALGFTELLAGGSGVKVDERKALTGTTGELDKFTYAAHTDGKIYVENRMSGPPRKVSLYVLGAPL